MHEHYCKFLFNQQWQSWAHKNALGMTVLILQQQTASAMSWSYKQCNHVPGFNGCTANLYEYSNLNFWLFRLFWLKNRMQNLNKVNLVCTSKTKKNMKFSHLISENQQNPPAIHVALRPVQQPVVHSTSYPISQQNLAPSLPSSVVFLPAVNPSP